MRLAHFHYDGALGFGLVDGATVRPYPARVSTLEALIALAPGERASLATEAAVPLESIRFCAPVAPHKNVFCVGRNYLGHAEEVARTRGIELKLPPVPTFFTKAPTAIANPEATLHLQRAITQQYDWEAELAIVIGKRCRDVAQAEALDVVFGYTALNDITARDIQALHQQWFKGKSLDETCPIGPYVVTADEIGDPQNLKIALRVDGETKQDANTSQMIFGVAQIVASLSRGMTLEPGDVIASGTPDGVGFARTPPEFLHDGAVVEVEIEKIGILRNRIALV